MLFFKPCVELALFFFLLCSVSSLWTEISSLWPHRPTAAGCKWNMNHREEEGRNKRRRWKSGFLLQEIWSVFFCFNQSVVINRYSCVICLSQLLYEVKQRAIEELRLQEQHPGKLVEKNPAISARVLSLTNNTFMFFLLELTVVFSLDRFTVLSETDGLLRETPSSRYYVISYL